MSKKELTSEEDIRGQFKEVVIYLMEAEYDEEAAESYTDALMFGSNEYHKIKSKEDKERIKELDKMFQNNFMLARDLSADKRQLKARVKALEEVVRDCIVRMETVSEETSNINHENILNTDLAYQALKTK